MHEAFYFQSHAYGRLPKDIVARAWMEFYYAKADKKVQNDRKCRTLLLKNGDIAVVYLYGGKGAQIGFRFFDDFQENMAELPFSKIYRISGVYSVKRTNGRSITSGIIREKYAEPSGGTTSC